MSDLTGNGWHNKNVLITGCTGLLGSWVTKSLVDNGACVVGLVRDWVPHSNLIHNGYYDKIRRVTGDIRNGDLMRRILAEYEVSHVFHIAAQSIVKIAENDVIGTFDTNVMGTVKLLEACRQSGVERVLVSSSDKAYGSHIELPYLETYALEGLHPYDCSKSCEDLVARMYNQTYGLSTVVMRSGNMYGPGDLNFSRIIPKTIRNLLNGIPPVIYGDGMMKRDYTYIEDSADACLALMERGKDGAYNVSGEAVYTVNEVIEIVTQILGIGILPRCEGFNNEIDSQWLDISKIKNDTGWHPAHSFEDGLKKTISYYKERI